MGITPGHAYTLMGAFEIPDRDGNMIRLWKCRNPWGKGEWKGDYRDTDDKWTDEMR